MTRFVPFFLIFFGLFCPGKAQERKLIDSLALIYSSSTADTTRILALTEIAKNYYRSNPDTAILIAGRAAKLSEDIHFEKGIGRANNMIGLGHWIKGNHMEALTYFQNSLPFFVKSGDKNGLGFAYNNIGLVYYYQNDYHVAKEYSFKALEVHQIYKNSEGIGLALNNVGLNLEALGDLPLALEYYKRALKVHQDAKMKTGIGQSLTNIGYIYYAQKDYPKALEFLNQAIIIQSSINDQSTLVSSLIGIAQTYLAQRDYDQSIVYGKQALTKATETKITFDAREASHVLYQAYLAKKDYENALSYFHLHKQLNDSIFSFDKTKAITMLQAKIELAEKQQELEIVQLEKGRQQKVTAIMIVSLLVMGALLFIIFLNRRKLQQAYHKLEITNHDLNEIKDKIEVQAEVLSKTNKANDKIFSIVSHDLRSPLQSLRGLFSLMENNQLSAEEFNKLIPDLSKRLQHATDITEELLHWSRNQLDVIQPKPVPVKVLPFFQKKTERFHQPASDKGIAFSINVPDEQLHFLADIDMMKTVLRNLVANAIKFCRAGDVITLTAIPEEDNVRLSVSDTGTGIPSEHLSKIFTDHGFSTSGTSGEKGTGLGLILCKEFVEKNAGKMWVESAEGQGASFHFTLPRA